MDRRRGYIVSQSNANKSAPVINLGPFSKGMNNVAPDTNLPESSLTEALNVNIDKEGNVFKRKGYTQVYAGKNVHSIHKEYFVDGPELKDLSGNVYRQDMSQTRFLAWEDVLGDSFYSDGNIISSPITGTLGIPTPPQGLTLSSTTGSLKAGIYQVTLCYKNPTTGELSGAELASRIILLDNAGIICSTLPASPITSEHPNGLDIVIFCSTANGKELYHVDTIVGTSDTYTITNANSSKKLLDTQFMIPLPSGHILKHFKARLYSAKDNVLWFSEPFRYGLCRTSRDFLLFAEKISNVIPVESGLFVIADKTYFLAGTDPNKMQQVIVSNDRSIEGTGISVKGVDFGLDSDERIAYWFTNKEAVIGLNSGGIKRITGNTLAIEENIDKGTSVYIETEGIRKVVTNFSNGGNSSEFSFGGQATSSIIRNGVVIP